MFRRVLIANRGEIARRVIRACHELGVEAVAVHSEADAEAPHVRDADRAVAIGPPPARESYLSIEAILEAARSAGADAVHPGYGFLSENPAFASAVEAAGITFIGPTADAIAAMGNKSKAREIMAEAGVPVVPGSVVAAHADAAATAASELGYPVMLKASAGGGGIGMAPCRDEAELRRAFESAASRARAAFGDDALYVERLVSDARHVEVQVVADREGRTVHLFERECSVQRRHQKVLEEAPCVALDAAGRARLGETAVQAARAIGYQNLGTVEFLLAPDGSFYFMEMNTRLQVEHPITECVTGIDLVQLQLRLAAGERLSPGEIRLDGSAIEMRIYAENPDKNFLPSPGTVTRLAWPKGEGVRIDSGIEEGTRVTPYYDPLLAKLVVHASRRSETIARARQAVAETVIEGLRTNLSIHARVLEDDTFQRGELTTHYLTDLLGRPGRGR